MISKRLEILEQLFPGLKIKLGADRINNAFRTWIEFNYKNESWRTWYNLDDEKIIIKAFLKWVVENPRAWS